MRLVALAFVLLLSRVAWADDPAVDDAPLELPGVTCALCGTCNSKLGLKVTRIGVAKTEDGTGVGSAEILDYDPKTKITAVVESRSDAGGPFSIQFVNFVNPVAPELLTEVTIADETTGGPNSVSMWGSYVAVSADGVPATADGKLRIYDFDGNIMGPELVLQGCAMPDMVKWLPDGKRIIMACEGEPGTQDVKGSDPRQSAAPNPEGSIGIVDVAMNEDGRFSMSLRRATIQSYFDSLTDAEYNALLAAGLRIDPRLNGRKEAGVDVEPEYIAFNPDYSKGYVTLQENNAIAVVDLTPGKEKVTNIWPLGRKSWGSPSNTLDASDRDGGVNLRSWSNLEAWYQPDTIAYARVGDAELLFLANEGDSKEEATRVKDLKGRLDAGAFPTAADLVKDGQLGRLNVDPLAGLKGGYDQSKGWDKQGPYDKLVAYGGRSWSIIDAKSGKLVYESGGTIESEMARAGSEQAQCFNCDRSANVFDDRSDNLGPEPEAIEAFKLGSGDKARTYVAVGLERMSGFLLYDVTSPAAPVLGGYYHARDFNLELGENTAALGDLAPEMIKFIPAADSGNGKPLLLIANEVSATVAAWQVEAC